MLGDWRTGTATEVENLRSVRQGTDEAIMPRFVVPSGRTPIGLPREGVTLIVINDPVGHFPHV